MTESKSRNWSTKTLARELLRFLKTPDLGLEETDTIEALMEALKDQIVEDEVGFDLSL